MSVPRAPVASLEGLLGTGTETAIEVEGLEKSYKDVRALCGIDLEVEAGTVLGLLGPNGAGKTTAVRILTTLLPPTAGSARVDGLDVVRDAAKLRERIGLAGQYAAVDEGLTGFENLEMVGRLYHLGKRASRERAGELLDRFDLAEAGDRLVKTYSGGMRRRLDLAAALFARPRGAVPRRADDGPRPAQPDRPVGGDRGAGGPGVDRAADDPVPRRGRPPRRPDRGDRPRQPDRRGHLRRAQAARRRRAHRGPARAAGAGRGGDGGARRARRRLALGGRRCGPRAGARSRGGDRRGGPQPRREADLDRRHRPAPPDPRRRLPHPHRTAARAGGRRGGRGPDTAERATEAMR